MCFLKFFFGVILFCLVTIVQSNDNPKQASFERRLVRRNTKTVSDGTNLHEELHCGEWLKSYSDEISYKEDIPVISDERCVWTIAVPLAVGYKFNITYIDDSTNQPNGGQEMILTGIQSQESKQPVLTYYKPTETGNFTIRKAQIVIVTFHTGQIDGSSKNGFSLKYDVIYGNSHVSALSTHHIFPSLTFDFKYPLDKNIYDAYELATFVFPPVRNVNNCQKNFLWYKSFGLDPDYDCKDSLFVYNFEISLEGVGYYEYSSRLCHSNATSLVEFDDILLLIFQTNGSRQFSGFSASFMGC